MAAAARGRSLLALGVVALFALESCVCAAVGCPGAFEVDFGSQPGWPAGSYEVVVTVDGATGSFMATLPFASCRVDPVYTGTHDWTVWESGCALTPDQQSLSMITFGSDIPTHVDVVVTRDGRQVGTGSYAPTSEQSQPNGPNCGTCIYAAPVTLALHF